MNQLQKHRGALPELLCPAGSPLALDAAIEGGADAVYLGGLGFNARINASNFSADDLVSGIRRAHAHGVKVYLTLNTLVYDREIPDYLRAAAFAQGAGADALIVADLGGAAAIHRHLPELALHASTQASAHSADAGVLFKKLGFSRMVVARELSLDNLRAAVTNSPIEIEAFIHGALCVCHSGQCLFSSLVGGRSGNRGECAQPCRLPFRTDKGRSDYPLSLKDLSLARHVPELIDAGLSSLKIEGRMRSPEYVLTVTRIWRRLLDEGRAANEDEVCRLGEAFSRDGFTDGYFTARIGHSMLGVRSEQDKQAGRTLEPFKGLTCRIPIQMKATLCRGEPISLT
ncbi:MAG: U32 family peptidase, partial [Clostridia bacterium]|nr:U32 family peptidase [Clostridia bacterium]